MKVTGERLTIGQASPRHQADHTARYEFAKKYVVGKRVLDIACGTGYGTELLAAAADSVTGVDIDTESIEYANVHHHNPKVTYVCAPAESAQLAPESFDVIVSFETIEHLEAGPRAAYLENMRQALTKDGVLILSTPNKLITSPWSEKPLNTFHVLEYYAPSLQAELEKAGYGILGWFGQRHVKNIFTKRAVYLGVRLVEKLRRRSLGVYDLANGPVVQPLQKGSVPRYFVVVLKK